MSNPTPNPERRPSAPLPAGGFNYRDLVLRGLFVVSVVGSLALVWWSLQRLTPLQQRTRELSTTTARLSAEIDQMEGKWTQSQVEQVLQKFGSVQGHLIVGQTGLEGWLKNLKEQVVAMALDVKADFGKAGPQAAGSQKLAVIPTTVSVDVKPVPGIESAQTPYQRVLQLSQRLTAQEKRADLVELSVAGGSNSVSRAVAVLNLWAGEEGQQ